MEAVPEVRRERRASGTGAPSVTAAIAVSGLCLIAAIVVLAVSSRDPGAKASDLRWVHRRKAANERWAQIIAERSK